jgi:hypothetical protein
MSRKRDERGACEPDLEAPDVRSFWAGNSSCALHEIQSAVLSLLALLGQKYKY